MGSAMVRLLVISWLALLLAGCEDPLAPERETALIAARGGLPQPSSDPQSTPISATQIDLSWPDNSSNETGWEIHRSTTGGNGTFSLLAQTPANTTTHSNVGLKPTTEYCYRIRWFRISGKKTTLGAFLTTTCATTFGPPVAASDVSATPGLYGAVEVAWITKSFTAEGFRLERAASSEGPWVKVETLGSWLRSYRDEGRATEQQVCYRIVALNSFGEALPSNVDCTTPPAAPAKLAAKSLDEHGIGLTWADLSAAEDGYEVQRAQEDFVWSVIATLPANASAYTDAALAVDTRYWYRVRATKDGGFSEFSSIVSTVTVSAAPAEPSYLLAFPGSSSAVTVYWGADTRSAEGFRVERSTDNGASWLTAGTTTGDQLVFSDEGRSSEQQVCYRAFAFNRLGDSPASNVFCTTPPAGPTNLVSIGIDEQTIEYQWRDNSSVEDGYELWFYGFDGDYYYYPVSLPPNTTSYQAGTFEAVYGVVARKDEGYSDWAFGPNVGATAAAVQKQTTTVKGPPPSAQRTPPKSSPQKGVGR
jgi:hypothetical protein